MLQNKINEKLTPQWHWINWFYAQPAGHIKALRQNICEACDWKPKDLQNRLDGSVKNISKLEQEKIDAIAGIPLNYDYQENPKTHAKESNP